MDGGRPGERFMHLVHHTDAASGRAYLQHPKFCWLPASTLSTGILESPNLRDERIPAHIMPIGNQNKSADRAYLLLCCAQGQLNCLCRFDHDRFISNSGSPHAGSKGSTGLACCRNNSNPR